MLLRIGKGIQAPPDTITANAFEMDNRLFQRAAGQTSGPVIASGTYSGGTPVLGMQGKVFAASDDSVLVNWTDMQSFAFGSGTWSGRIPGVPQATKCYYQARVKNATAVTAQVSNNCVIGDWFVGLGQSTLAEISLDNTSSLTATGPDGTSQFVLAGVAGFADTYFDKSDLGAAISTFLIDYQAATGIPCGYFFSAIPGSDYSDMKPGTSIWTALLDQLAVVGNDVAGMFLIGGYGDANSNFSPGTSLASIKSIGDGIRAVTGRTAVQLPIFMASMARDGANDALGAWPANVLTGFEADSGFGDSEKAQLLATQLYTGFVYSNSNEDALLGPDHSHWQSTAWNALTARLAQSAQFTIEGTGGGVAAWFITGIEMTSATTTTVNLQHSLGTDFTPTTGITSFEVSEDDGATWNYIDAVADDTVAVR